MDELGILRAQVTILERQMKETNIQMRKLIEAFEKLRPPTPQQEDGYFDDLSR